MKKANHISCLLFCLLAAGAMTSCCEFGVGTGADGNAEVKFDVYTAQPIAQTTDTENTRGAEASPSALQTKGIGVFAFYQKAKSNGYPVDFNKYSGEPNYMYNQQVTATKVNNTVTWDYTPHKYWPNNKNDQLSFFAYAPYDEATAWEDLHLETNLKGDRIERRFVVEDDVADQQDLVWADPILNQTKPADLSALQFNFRHLCARLSASAKVNTAAKSIYVTVDTLKVTGAFCPSGTLVYTPDDHTCRWEDLAGGITKTYLPFAGSWVHDEEGHTVYETFVVDTVERFINEEDGYMFLIPGTQDVTLTAIVSQRSRTTSFVKSYTITKTITDMALEENKAYNFLLNIHLTPVTFTGEVDATWSLYTINYISDDNGQNWHN